MLPEVILLSNAVIDRHARLIIERDEEVPGRVWIYNGGETRFFYDGDDARIIWDFYFPDKNYLT